jgi:hypothetical protein
VKWTTFAVKGKQKPQKRRRATLPLKILISLINISHFQPSTSKNPYNKKKNLVASQGTLIKMNNESRSVDNAMLQKRAES